MHIGRLIKQQLEAQDKTVSWLAHELAYCRTNIYKIFDKKSIDTDLLEKPRDFDLLAKQDLPTFGYNMIAPLKSWCWGSILFYPFKISRFS